MIYVFTGPDRVGAQAEIKRILGEDYEVIEGEGLEKAELFNIFQGASLFSEVRKILIKDLTPARGSGESIDFYENLKQFIDTPHEVVIWESTTPNRKSYRDFIALPGVKQRKFEEKKDINVGLVFEIFDLALHDGQRAVKQLSRIEADNDPYMFFGLMVSQAIKKYQLRQGKREGRILSSLADLDMQMKSSTIEPWDLIKVFLLKLKDI